MKFKYSQFLVLLLFLVPMLACSTLFSSGSNTQNSSQDSLQDSPSTATPIPNTSLAVPAADSDNGSNPTQGVTTNDQQDSNSSGSTATSIQPILAINSDALPFQTYAIQMSFTATGGESVASMQMTSQRDIPNQAISYQVSISGVPDADEFGGGNMTFVVIEGTAYMPFDGQCMAIATGENPLNQFLNGNSEFLDDETLQVVFQGDEMLLGVPVKVYAVTGFDDAEISGANGTIYVYTASNGGEIVLKAEMTAISTTNPLTDAPQSTNLAYTFDVTDPDQPVNISIPDGCENALQMPNLGMPSANASDSGSSSGQSDTSFPTYPGSSMVANVAGIQTFMIPQSAIDAAQISPRDFFVQTFTDLGYTLGQELEAGPSTNLTFQGGDSGNIQLTLAAEGDGVNATLMALP
ncbi:MAG: hypothetical protein AAF702_18440 [Chloroflexota bacterium]